jgi:hypothetical protein
MAKANVLIELLGGTVVLTHFQGKLAAAKGMSLGLNPLQEETSYPLPAIRREDGKVMNIEQRPSCKGRESHKAYGNTHGFFAMQSKKDHGGWMLPKPRN